MLTNYHTHCCRCGHAGGSVEDYVVAAMDNGFDKIGMSDHVPYPDFNYGARMNYDEKDVYLDEVIAAREKYKDKIQIFSGFEAEYLPQYNSYYEELLKDDRCDYLILGVHFFEKDDGIIQYTYDIYDSSLYIKYAERAVEAMKTGYFKYLCHPDLIGVGDFDINDDYKRAFDILIDGAVKYGFILEYNANGLRRGINRLGNSERYPYPIGEFWNMIKDTDIKVIAGSDCHNPKLLYDEYMKKSLEFLDKAGFNRILDI